MSISNLDLASPTWCNTIIICRTMGLSGPVFSYSIVVVFLIAIWYFGLVKKISNFIRIVRFSKTVPGPKTWDFVRNASGSKILPYLKECADKYSNRFGTWIGKDYILFICDAEDAKRILSSQEILYKSRNHEILRCWLGDGLLIAGGEKWQKSRKFLTPAFHFNILKQFHGAMTECADILISKLSTVADGTDVDIYPYITLFALDVISETAMGIKKHVQLDSGSEYVKAVQGICQLLSYRLFSFIWRSDLFFRFSPLAKRQAEILQVLHDETDAVITARRKVLMESEVTSTNEAINDGSKRRLAFLDMLLIGQLEGLAISDEQIRAEVDTFMFEGHDTTSSAISFALLLLSSHPDIQNKAYLEAVDCVSKESEPMPYMEAVIKETLRLYPSVPLFSRNLKQDYKLGDLIIPQGVQFTMAPFVIHRNEQEYQKPQEFNPDRFLNKEKIHPFAHVPFSAGPRNCIGQRFAILELKNTLAKLLRRFEFHKADYEPEIVPELILKSANGIRVRITPR